MTTLRSPEADGSPGSTQQGRRRDPLFDNAKMLLIVLVTVGHTWSQLPDSATVHWAYDFLYGWHMPAFVLVTGYLSRSMTWESGRLWSLVRTLAVPYVIFESALTFVHVRFGGAEVNDFLLVPHSPMWFLLALIGWRLLTPLLLRVPRWRALGAAVAISLAAGLIPYDFLAVNRILGFLPFFVLGLHLRRSDWDTLRRYVTVPVALAVLGVWLVLSRYTDTFITSSWFHYDTTYQAFDVPLGEGLLTRLVVLAIGLVGCAAFFALVPKSHSWLTVLGASTMVVYLFHDFPILAMTYSSFPDWAEDHLLLAFAMGTGGAVLVGLGLAVPPVARFLNRFADPIGHVQQRRRKAPTSD